MKKFLLVASAIIVSMSGMAKKSDVTPMSKVLDVKIPTMKNDGVFRSLNEKSAAQSSFYAGVKQNTRPVMKAAKRAKAISYSDLIPTYAAGTTYVYTLLTGLVTQPLYDGASFFVEDGKVYLSAFTNIDYIEGVIESGNNALKAEYGADSITFNVVTNEPVASDNSGKQYYMGLATFNSNTHELVRNAKTTIGAYYFADSKEIYIPLYNVTDFICLFAEGATTPEDGYIVANLDIVPQDIMNQRVSKATFKGTIPAQGQYPAEEWTGDAEAMLYGSIYVRGFNPINSIKNSWVEFSQSEQDENMLTVDDTQLLGIFNYYTDETRTETATVAFEPVGALSDFSDFTTDYTSSYFVIDNEADETTTIESTGMDMYGIYGVSDNSSMAGPWGWLQNLSITITYEPVYAGISNTKVSKASTTEYFDLQGRKVNGSQKGLLIKKSILSDGTVKSVKMLNK